MAVLLVVMGVLGLVVGSFLNVVIHRIPLGESLLRPGSHCPHCEAPIKPWHNIPLMGWLLVRGRCASCGEWIGLTYPLVELATAALFVAVTARLDQVGPLSALPAYLYFTAMAVVLAVIDVRVRRLPNHIVLPSYPVLAVLLLVPTLWQPDWPSFGRALLGGVILFAFYFGLAFIYPAGMGFGDVKLAGLVGAVLAYLSWPALLIGAFMGFLLGGLFGIGLMAARRGGRKTAIPFGPFMLAGAFVGIFAADPIARFYVDTMLGL